MAHAFKYISQITEDANGNNIGPVPISAFLKKTEEAFSIKYTPLGLLTNTLTSFLDADEDLTFEMTSIENDLSSLAKYLIGTDSKKLKANIPDHNVYDLLTNRPFSDYEQDASYIYIDPSVLETKVLGYKNSNYDTAAVLLLDWVPVHEYSTTTNKIIPGVSLDDSSSATLTPIANALDLYVSKVSDSSPWEVHFKKNDIIVNNRFVSPVGGATRQKVVTNDVPTFLTNKLLKLSHKGIEAWGSATLPPQIDDATAYTSGIKIIANKSTLVIDAIDTELGLVLLREPAPKDVAFSYYLNTTQWAVLSGVNFNPLAEQNIDKVTVKLSGENVLYYSVNNSNKYLSSSCGSYSLNLQSTLISKPTIATIERSKATFSALDIRTPGGRDLNPSDSSSYVSDGFVGVNPTQMNIVIVKLPDSVIEDIVDQFQELHYAGNYATVGGTRISYMQNFSITDPKGYPEDQDNSIKDEIMMVVHRYLPVGVLAIVADKNNTLIYKD